MDKKRELKGFIICLVATLLLSQVAILISALQSGYRISTLNIALWRNLFVSILLLPVVVIGKEGIIKIRDLPFYIVFALVQTLFNILWTESVFINGASLSTVLVYTSIVFAPILGKLIFKERFSISHLPIILLCLAGCYIMAGVNLDEIKVLNIKGVLLGLISGLLYAFYTICGKHAAKKGYKWKQSLFVTFSISSIFMLIVNLVREPETLFSLGGNPLPWILLILLALGPTLFGYGLYNKSLSYLSCGMANIITSLEAVLTALTAFILLKERLEPGEWLGSLIIFIAVILYVLKEVYLEKRKEKLSEMDLVS